MLPAGIPTVTVKGRFLTPDGRPLTGQIVWRAPALLTFGAHDVILGGPVTAPLDTNGVFEVTLPATDAPGMNPSGWSYTVAEQFPGVAANRVYQVLLPAETPLVDLADLAPTDPTTPNYVAVRGANAYEVAVAGGFTGTPAQWLASLVGPRGAPGVVTSVNGQSAPAITLTAGDVGALPASGVVSGGNLLLDSPTGDYRGFSFTTASKNRWVYQVDNTAETGADAGSNFELANWSDAGGWKSAVLYGLRATGDLGIGTKALVNGAKLTVSGATAFKNTTAPTENPAGGAVLWAQGGTLNVRQSNGATFPLVNALPATGGVVTGQLAVNQPADGTTDIFLVRDKTSTWVAAVSADGLLMANKGIQTQTFLRSLNDVYALRNIEVGGSNAVTNGQRVVAFNPAATVPTTAPANGGVLYAEAGALKWRGANGTVTTIAPA
uniref:hypothetical protein n=1 Tax=Streptomyces polyasparticus TaxID=2767826 RepID=UPI00280A6C27|nr:hypothetical protein [Streptomyces polyasparticus]